MNKFAVLVFFLFGCSFDTSGVTPPDEPNAPVTPAMDAMPAPALDAGATKAEPDASPTLAPVGDPEIKPECRPGMVRICNFGCGPGHEHCGGVGFWGECDAPQCDCTSGEVRPCYTGIAGTEGVGICHAGVQSCESGFWGICIGDITPQANDACGDGVDNNCNGKIDEGCPLEVEVVWFTPGQVIEQYINLYGCWGHEAADGSIVCEGPGTLASWGVLVDEYRNVQCVVADSASITCRVWVTSGKVLRMNSQYGVSSQMYGCNLPQYGDCTNLPEVKLVATGTVLTPVVKYGPGTYDANWQVTVP